MSTFNPLLKTSPAVNILTLVSVKSGIPKSAMLAFKVGQNVGQKSKFGWTNPSLCTGRHVYSLKAHKEYVC